jgi:hypothetical protein
MDDDDDLALSLETLDDIVFHDAETDDGTEKWQSKTRASGSSRRPSRRRSTFSWLIVRASITHD